MQNGGDLLKMAREMAHQRLALSVTDTCLHAVYLEKDLIRHQNCYYFMLT